MTKIFAPLVILSCLTLAFTLQPSQEKPVTKVKWLTWQEAVELNKTQPKKFFIDVYTDWCGWCKVMDKNTFENESIAEYLSKNFHCVKLNAEMKEPIEFNGHKFEFVASGGRGGVHTLAYSLLDGNMSYPTVVYLTEKFERVVISPGYKTPDKILPELKYTVEEIYKTKTFQDYVKASEK